MISAPPEPVERVSIPETFPVSAAANYRGCKLKLVTSTREWRSRHLVSGPEAAIGSLIHRILERAPHSPDEPATLFDNELRATAEELRADPKRAHFADLPATRSYMEWRNVRASVLAKCGALRRHRSTVTTSSARFREAKIRTGREIPFFNGRLRLAGRSDMIERITDHQYLIRDFKTGRIFDPDGNIFAGIRRQLHFYALLAEADDPDCEIHLSVESATDKFDVKWGDRERAETREELSSMVTDLHPGSTIPAGVIARAGDECCRCPIRHRCRAYAIEAPIWWKNIPSDIEFIAADTWGTVVAIEDSGEFTNQQLVDVAGRTIKVRGLRKRSGSESLRRGDRVWLFGLEKTGTGRGWNGRPFQPHAFHEIAPDSKAKTAFTTEIFAQYVR